MGHPTRSVALSPEHRGWGRAVGSARFLGGAPTSAPLLLSTPCNERAHKKDLWSLDHLYQPSPGLSPQTPSELAGQRSCWEVWRNSSKQPWAGGRVPVRKSKAWGWILSTIKEKDTLWRSFPELCFHHSNQRLLETTLCMYNWRKADF